MGRLIVEQLCTGGLGPFNLVVPAGECVAIAGPSGAGKTRLLRAIADLDPHRGRVSLDETECTELAGPAWRRRVGLLRADSRWWRTTVGEHLHDLDSSWLAQIGFDARVLDWSVERLSSGERQRLALLRLLSNRPDALLLDEPTAHLDAEATSSVEALVSEHQRRANAAVIWVTHDSAQAERVAERRFRLADGTLTEHT